MKEEKIRKSRKKRGMTLAEVIISIAIMAVLALMLTTIGMTIDRYRRDTNARNTKIAFEGPAAELQQRDTPTASNMGKLIDEDFKITVSPAVSGSVEIDGKLYSTSDELTGTGATDADGVEIYDGNTTGHFMFVYIDPSVSP
ncbi:MAG: type II secretion system GspH family protein [Ruminococcus sp.]|nr:type II secretion system GspH family protein [Ruminococcus sp.]